MTPKGRRDKIKHPGYGDSDLSPKKTDFWFSDDIEKWIRNKKWYKKKGDRRIQEV